jgi:CubicO group peptidase (beta-lactamase class C family)
MDINMKTTLLLSLIFSSLTTAPLYAEDRWPVPDWESAVNQSQLKTPQCEEFVDFATHTKKVVTDSLLVIKDGQIKYEYYDGTNGVEKPHILWSVSKTLTGVLLGTAVRDGRINLNQAVSDYFPSANPNRNYPNIELKNLLYLDAGYIWHEGLIDASENPVVSMLYGPGHTDMAAYAASRRMITQGPGYRWNYSTGLPTLTMGVLKKVYGDEYDTMPWRNLFNPLGIKSASFERDSSGTFIGGANAYATSRDLAKIGYMFLHNGEWNGQMILPPEWMNVMLTPSPGYVSPGTIIEDVQDTGVYGGSLWLNKEVKKGQGKPYPYSPENMFAGIGYMGQLLIVLPTQNMVIVRTGYDHSFNDKIDAFVTRALSCFHDPKTKLAPVPEKHRDHISISKIFKNIRNIVEAKTLQSSIAKIVCSCHLVSGVDINTCLKRHDFGVTKHITKINVRESFETDGNISIGVRLSGLTRIFSGNRYYAKAYYDPQAPEYGCTLK